MLRAEKRRYQDAVQGMVNFRDWVNPLAITLTLRQSLMVDVGQPQYINANLAKQNVRHFMNVLNSKLLSKAERRFGLKLGAAFVSEHDRDKRLHYHGLIECPKWEMLPKMRKLVHQTWTKTTWGYNQIALKLADDDWQGYCFKAQTKPDYAGAIEFELWSPPLKTKREELARV
jgi:hypothetical protein